MFPNKKEVENSQNIKETNVSDEPVEEKQELEFDENGWLTYPNGIKLKINYDDFLDSTEIAEEFCYKSHELYESYHTSNGRVFTGIDIKDSNVTCYWEIITNKLVCIVRKDDRIMTKEEINDCIKFQKQYIKEMPSLPGIAWEVLLNIENGIKNQGIRQSYIENCFNQNSKDDRLSVGKFFFLFRDNYLCDFYYDGYNILTCLFFDEDVRDNYYMVAKQFGQLIDRKIKKLIDKQVEFRTKIDKDILNSYPINRQFSYDEDGLCINYIGIAAIYQQCDVSQELFLESTFGHYVLLSKTTNNGITTTKIRAYNNTVTFYNGHSLLEQSISVEQNDINGQNYSSDQNEEYESTEGFVYVMINPSLEGMVKIGKTTRSPNDRVKELSSATGIPTPFILVFHKKFKDCHYTEKAIHQYLEKNGYRISDNREFFKMPVTDAINVVQLFFDIENNDNNSVALSENSQCDRSEWEKTMGTG